MDKPYRRRAGGKVWRTCCTSVSASATKSVGRDAAVAAPNTHSVRAGEAVTAAAAAAVGVRDGDEDGGGDGGGRVDLRTVHGAADKGRGRGRQCERWATTAGGGGERGTKCGAWNVRKTRGGGHAVMAALRASLAGDSRASLNLRAKTRLILTHDARHSLQQSTYSSLTVRTGGAAPGHLSNAYLAAAVMGYSGPTTT